MITVVYVSIDKLDMRRKWEEIVQFNRLEGYHILADDVLIEDMWKFLGDPQGVIPRYALIDKNGNVYLANAARPGYNERLISQIRMLLDSQ